MTILVGGQCTTDMQGETHDNVSEKFASDAGRYSVDAAIAKRYGLPVDWQPLWYLHIIELISS